jgi:hypothetical protein
MISLEECNIYRKEHGGAIESAAFGDSHPDFRVCVAAAVVASEQNMSRTTLGSHDWQGSKLQYANLWNALPRNSINMT